MNNRKSFTLIELIVVIVIVGILASIGLPNYTPIKERALDREARSALALILAAEKVYRMENGDYYPHPAGTDNAAATLNDNLKLSLPTAGGNWSYSITTSGSAGSLVATISAARLARTWTLLTSSADGIPSCTGTCYN